MAGIGSSLHGKTPSSKQPGPRFLPFLPDDNNSLSNAASAEAVQLISDALGELLSLPAKEFWTVVVEDASLHACLDSFLRFRRRGFDQLGFNVAGENVMSEGLARQVFLVFLRLVTPVPNGSPGPCPPQQAELLYDRWIIDIPKLMDLAVLYGPDNLLATQKLMTSLFSLQQSYLLDVGNMVEPLVENLSELHARCNELCARVGKGDIDLTSNVLDAAGYLLDACVTLKIFAEVFPPAGRLLLGPNDTAPLVGVLSNLHRRLLPALLHAVRQPGAAEAAGITAEQAKKKIDVVAVGIESLVYQLITSGFLSSVMSPADREQSRETRGEQVLALLMSVAQSSSQTGPKEDKPLIQDINQHFGLDAAIVEAAQQGIISVDEAQFDYLMALLGSTTTLSAPECTHAAPGTPSRSHPAAANPSLTSNSGALESRQTGTSSTASSKVDPAMLRSLVSQVKEVLPDFGDGFVTACLDTYGYNAEQVIHHLLEGSLPPSLSSLDAQLTTWPPPDTAGGAAEKGKGKARAEPSGKSFAENMSWRTLAAQAEDAGSSAAARAEAVSASGQGWNTSVMSGAGQRQVARSTLRALGGASNDVKSLTKRLGDNMQWDYDDEYDDSFDDLTTAGADGVADVEGDELADKSQPRADAAEAGRSRGAPPPASSSGQGRGGAAGRGPGGRGQQQQKTKLWVLDGRIYNYPKEGAQLVVSQMAAEKAVEAAKMAAEAIYGLGAGGNIPIQPPRASGPTGDDDEQEEQGDGPTNHGGAGTGRGGHGRGGPPRGGGRGSHAHKDRHKAAIGNHHRKDRAFKKMGFQP